MKINFKFLSTKEKKVDTDFILNIIENEYPELSETYNEIVVIIGRNRHIRDNSFQKIIKKSLSPGDNIIELDPGNFDASSLSSPPLGWIKINNNEYKKMEIWKRELAIRHECGHLLHPDENQELRVELNAIYGSDYINNFVKYRREFCAHSSVIQKAPELWLTSPVGFRGDIEPPSVAYKKIKKSSDKKQAIKFALLNIVHILSLQLLYDLLPEEFQDDIKEKRDLNDKYLKEFFKEIQEDTEKELPCPYSLLTIDDFLSTDEYYSKINDLLNYAPE